MIERDLARSRASSKPRIVAAGVPRRTPEATIGGRSSNGTVLRFAVSLHSSSRSWAARPVQSVRAQVELDEMRVGAAGEHVEAAFDQRRRERVGVRADRALVLAERVGRRDAEAGRLRSDRVHQRAALHAGEVRAVERRRVLLAAEDEARARAGERLVRRRGDEVAVRDRARDGDRRRRARRSAPCRTSAARRPRLRSRGTCRPRPSADRPSRRRRSAPGGPPSPSRARRRSRPSSSRATTP